MNNKLRLFLWEECDRDCTGCCNKDYDIESIPLYKGNYKEFDEILLTGGEPMLYPARLSNIIDYIKSKTDAKIILYTAKFELPDIVYIINVLDGITVTFHSQKDVDNFEKAFIKAVGYFGDDFENLIKDRSFRINSFVDIDISKLEKLYSYKYFKIKKDINWIKNCPLPKGEVLYRWSGEYL
jgi:organic radical activating enzyme